MFRCYHVVPPFIYARSLLAEDVSAFFQSEPDFVSELIVLAQAEEGEPEEQRVLALRALAVQLGERSRHNTTAAALRQGGQGGLLSSLLSKSVTSIIAQGAGEPGPEPRYSPMFLEALLNLANGLTGTTAGLNALNDAAFMATLIPLLRDTHPDHVHLVSLTVKILEVCD